MVNSASSQNRSSVVDNFGVFSYKNRLIWFAMEDSSNWKHREERLKLDFMIKAYITKLDSEILAEKPIFEPDIFGGKTKDAPESEAENIEIWKEPMPTNTDSGGYDISDEWNMEDWKGLLCSLFDMARSHSFCVVQLYNEPPFWNVYTWREIFQIQYNEKKQPISCDVKYTITLPLSEKQYIVEEHLTFEDQYSEDGSLSSRALLIPFGKPKGDELGIYDLDDKWGLAVLIGYCILDISNNSAKTSGFYHTVYGDSISPTARTNIDKALDLVSSCRGIGATEQTLKEIRSIFPSKPEFTILALEKFMKAFAGACGLPMSYFNSESEQGNIFNSGASGEQLTINKKMHRIFAAFKKPIMKLVEMRWGILVDDVFPNIEEGIEEDTFEEDIIEPKKNKTEEVKEFGK